MSTEKCSYEDAGQICRGDGYLCDEDQYYEGYDPTDMTYPCPCCNTQVYLEGAKEDAETCSSWSDLWRSGTGETIWIHRSRRALAANPDQAPKILATLGPVHALVADRAAPEGYVVSVNNLPAAGAAL